MKKRMGTPRFILAVIALIFVILAAGYLFLVQNYALINGNFFRRDVTAMNFNGIPLSNPRNIALCGNLQSADLRGTGLTLEDYQYLQESLPNCQILWDVPIQDNTYSLDTESITVTSLTDADLTALSYLKNLKNVDASACQDYEELVALQKQHPDCRVNYSVPLAGKVWPCDTEFLELNDVDLKEMNTGLGYLPHIAGIHFSGKLPSRDDLLNLQTIYPDIYFTCEVEGKKLSVGSNILQTDLSDIPLDYDSATELLSYYPNLEEANMLNCGLSDEDMFRICDEHPDAFFLWEMDIDGIPCRTDAEEIDISGTDQESTEHIESLLPYFSNLKKVVMCYCGLDSETMDDLNSRYEDIRFVWAVNLGYVDLRTDATWFAPVAMNIVASSQQLEEFKYCTDIICIDLGHQSINNIEWAAYMPHLQYLIIADTPVADISPLEGLTELKFLEMFQTGCRDYSPLVSCTGLEDLNLCWTYGSSEPIRQMTWLKRLWWDGCYASTHDLAEDLPDTECNFHSGSSTGDSWRLGQLYKEQRDIIGMPYMIG